MRNGTMLVSSILRVSRATNWLNWMSAVSSPTTRRVSPSSNVLVPTGVISTPARRIRVMITP